MSLLAGRRLATAFVCAAIALAASTAAAADDPLADRVKAAFLFNFARFVTWPPARFTAPDSPVELCVLGSAEFAEVLEETMSGKSAGTHALHVRRVEQARELLDCHVAYIPGESNGQLERVLSQVAGHGVLTVYDAPSTVPGGIVRFYIEDRRVRFEINAAAAEHENLQVSSKLLAVARVVAQ